MGEGKHNIAEAGYPNLSVDRPSVTLEVEAGDVPPGWDDALLADDGVVFHSEAWGTYKTADGGGDPLFFQWRGQPGGEVVGRGLGIRRPPRGSRVGRVAARISFDAPPAGGVAADFVSPLAAWARKSPAVVEVELGSLGAVGSWGPGPLPRPMARCEYLVAPGTQDDLWSGVRQLARRKVKRAQKHGLQCREARLPDELLAFAEVYRATEVRLSRTKDYVPDPGFDIDRFAESLLGLIQRGCARLYGAYAGEGLEAGTVFTTFGRRAYMIYSAATDSGRAEGAPFLVMFTALRELRDAGFEHLNLGGAASDAADPDSADHGLHLFKTRFGAAPRPQISASLRARPMRARAIAGLRRLVRR